MEKELSLQPQQQLTHFGHFFAQENMVPIVLEEFLKSLAHGALTFHAGGKWGILADIGYFFFFFFTDTLASHV